MSVVQVDGTTLYWEEAGAGPDVLFVHGMAGFGGVWSDQMSRLSDAFHTVSYDRRGHTRSPRGDTSTESVELHADDAAGLIRELGLAPVNLVGSSGGARICIDLLRRYPHLVRSAVLSEPPVFALSPSAADGFLARVRPAIGAALESDDPASAVDAFFGIIDPGFWANAPEDRKQAYRDNLPAMLADLTMAPYSLTTADLAAIERPCLMLYGSASLPWFRDIAAIVAAAIPNCTLREIPGAGHATNAARPAEFSQAVREFLTSTP